MAEQTAERVCAACKVTKPSDEFGQYWRSARQSFSWHSYCRPCKNLRHSPEMSRTSVLRVRYNLSREQYDAMWEAQGRACATCQASETTGKNWHVDHDHACCPVKGRSCGKCVRGILCHGCNLALGGVRDDPATLRRMIAYLEKQ